MATQSIHQFAEKVALVTDGESAIGRAVAMQLALQGCFVIVGFGGQTDESRQTMRGLQELGTLANAIETDISSVDGARSLVSEVEKMFGRLDLLVNCAKYHANILFENAEEDSFSDTLDRNLKAAYFITQSATALMSARPKPKIVNIVSACDTPETQGDPLFFAVQAAVIGFTRSLAFSLPKKFRTNCVAVSEKRSVDSNLDPELFRPKTSVSADDAARTVLYLLSSEAIGLNGQILNIE